MLRRYGEFFYAVDVHQLKNRVRTRKQRKSEIDADAVNKVHSLLVMAIFIPEKDL